VRRLVIRLCAIGDLLLFLRARVFTQQGGLSRKAVKADRFILVARPDVGVTTSVRRLLQARVSRVQMGQI
jgi:hypothetical protein